MDRKILSIMGGILLLLAFQSCASKPEESLLKRYFHALSLNDTTTLSTMALEPVTIPMKDWEVLSVGEENIQTPALPEMDQKEQELKKSLEDHVGTTLDARDELDNAKYDLERARTRSARRTAQQKVEEMQAKYDAIYEEHKELQKQYNEAKAVAQREEEISAFSLGDSDLPNIRDFSGEMRSKEVDVRTISDEGEKDYRIYLRTYTLKDETLAITHRGRWIIVKFELLG
jgi:hypothetical protein